MAGWLADRIAPRFLIFFSLVATGALGLWYSTAPSMTGLMIIFGCWGLTTGLTFWASVLKRVKMIAHHSEQGRFFGILDGGRGLVEALLATVAPGLFAFATETRGESAAEGFNPLSYQIPKNNKASLKPEPYSGFLLCFNPCRPTSRGHIEIASKKPEDAALIDPNYLSTQKDIDEVIQGSRLMRKIMQAPALRGITVEEVLPGPVVETDEQMLQYFRDNSGSIYHLCGSCAMGADTQKSVVDKRLKVHGLEGLRVVDASIFPNVTSGNTHAAVLMVAEKGADLILQDARLHYSPVSKMNFRPRRCSYL